MARVDWTREALFQIAQIADYIALFDSAAAARTSARLVALGESLSDFPNRGRPAAGGTRELVMVPPYILSYAVVDDTVFILGVRHGARQP